MKQLGLGVLNYESGRKKLPPPGQCDSTGGASTTYMIHATTTLILPYIEQTAVYDMFDHKTDPFVAYSATPSGDAFKTATGCLLHKRSKGRNYDDPPIRTGKSRRNPRSIRSSARRLRFRMKRAIPVHGYGGIDYMVLGAFGRRRPRQARRPTAANHAGRFGGLV